MADTDPATALDDTAELTPGRYDFLVVGGGYGHTRVRLAVRPGAKLPVAPPLTRNHASAALGATATGDGVNQGRLIDETEATDWASLTAPVKDRSVTVDLAGTEPVPIRRIQVSAMLRPNISDPADPGGQNRFTALRSFQVLACDATRRDCSSPQSYTVAYTSPADAFQTRLPRPRGADLIIKSFGIPPTRATHLTLRALSTQCTGNPLYAGEQDGDPNSATDCATAGAARNQLRAAEFQAFSR